MEEIGDVIIEVDFSKIDHVDDLLKCVVRSDAWKTIKNIKNKHSNIEIGAMYLDYTKGIDLKC